MIISKEQLKHIDSDSFIYEINLSKRTSAVEQLIINAYSKGLKNVMVVIEDDFADNILNQLEDGGYTVKKIREDAEVYDVEVQ